MNVPISPLVEGIFRSRFEAEAVLDLLSRNPDLRVEDVYEAITLSYTVPARIAKYTPDLFFADRRLAIELKGHFRDTDTRMKYLYFAESNPDITLKFVLQRRGVKIYKGSKTTQEAWLRKHGLEVAFKTIPQEWLDD